MNILVYCGSRGFHVVLQKLDKSNLDKEVSHSPNLPSCACWMRQWVSASGNRLVTSFKHAWWNGIFVSLLVPTTSCLRWCVLTQTRHWHRISWLFFTMNLKPTESFRDHEEKHKSHNEIQHLYNLSSSPSTGAYLLFKQEPRPGLTWKP